MTATTETAQDRAGRLGKAIWLSVFPHSDLPDPESYRSQDNRPPEEVRMVEVTDPAQVKPGDVLLSLEEGERRAVEYNRAFAFNSTRENVQSYEGVRVVASVSPKSIMVYESVQAPRGGWGSCDPERFGEPMNYNPDPVRYSVPASGRRLALLGHLDDIRDRLRAHPDYAAWVEAYAQAKQENEAAQAEAQRIREANEALAAPLRTAVDRVNEIAGEQLLKFSAGFASANREVSTVVPWLGEGKRLQTYLAGLAQVRKWGMGEGLELEAHLKTLGFPRS